MNESLSKTLRELRLGGMAETLEVRLQEASSSNLTHLEFLELILADESLVRGDRRIDRGVRRASFRDVRRLEDFDFSFNKSIERTKIFDLASGHFLRHAKDVLMCGPPGTGKPQPPQYPAGYRGMRGGRSPSRIPSIRYSVRHSSFLGLQRCQGMFATAT